VTQFGRLQALIDGRVEFVIVGGLAATIHGSARVTQHIDIVYCRGDEKKARLVAALAPYRPNLRGAPPNLPFEWSVDTLKAGLNFTVVSTLRWIDLLGEVTGGGGYESVRPDAVNVEYYGHQILCVSLSKLIALKRAAGRPKDNEVLAELETILDLQRAKNKTNRP